MKKYIKEFLKIIMYYAISQLILLLCGINRTPKELVIGFLAMCPIFFIIGRIEERNPIGRRIINAAFGLLAILSMYGYKLITVSQINFVVLLLISFYVCYNFILAFGSKTLEITGELEKQYNDDSENQNQSHK